MRALQILSVLAAVGLLVTTGCQRPKTYESEIEITRLDVTTVEPPLMTDGKERTAVKVLDVEFIWTACGQQEVIRGSPEFLACMEKGDHLKLGKKLPVKVLWHVDPTGAYDWDITEMGGCARPYEDGDNASFDTVQECEPAKEHGASVGFRCNRLPQKELIAKCPWFAKR